MLARAVLDRVSRGGTRLAAWVRAWLEAAPLANRAIEEIGREWLKTMSIERFGYGIRPPGCEGDRPDWAAPPRLVPDKDILLYCDETAADPGDGREDLGLKLTANRSYGLTVRSRDRDTRLGERSPGNITVEELDAPAALADILGGAILRIDSGTFVIPPGGTASLRIPFSSLVGERDDRGDQARFSADLYYNADQMSLLLEVLVLALSILSGGTAGIGAAELLHELGRMVLDGALLDDHRVVAETLWVTPPDSHGSPSLSAGRHHTCRVNPDNTVACWGLDAATGSFSAVSAGVGHSCGLRTDRTIACWGNNDSGQTDAPAGSFWAVGAGDSHTCGLRIDDRITCWGSNEHGQTNAPSGWFGRHHRLLGRQLIWAGRRPSGVFEAVTAGTSHSCGLRTDGVVECWGNMRMRTADPGETAG